jgi:hypothetical protein
MSFGGESDMTVETYETYLPLIDRRFTMVVGNEFQVLSRMGQELVRAGTPNF